MDASTPSPLVAYRDRTVSRIRTKYEVRDAEAADNAAFMALAKDIAAVAAPRLAGGRWLAREDVARFERLLGARYDGLPNLVSRKDEERLPTRAKPRSWAVFRSRLHAVPDADRHVRLNTAALFATRKMVCYSTLRSPHAWLVHAQERLHERINSAVRADLTIANAVMDSMAIVSFACFAFDASRFHGNVAVPCGDGMLLGDLVPVPPDIVLGRSAYCDAKNGAVKCLDFDDYRERLWTLGKASSATAFLGRTYVGPDEMRPAQFEYVRRWRAASVPLVALNDALTDDFRGSGLDYNLAGRDGTYMRDGRIKAEMEALASTPEALQPVCDILNDPEMSRAAGFGRAA